MSDITEHMHPSGGGFSRKLGPLPVWAWGLILGAVIVAFMWYRNRSGVSSTGSAANLTDPYGNAGLYTGNDLNAANADHATASTAQKVRTNAAWVRVGVQYETGKGRNALVVLTALQRYLAGLSLSQHQDEIVSDVLKNVGTPPRLPAKTSKVRKPHTDTPSKPQGVTTPGTKQPPRHSAPTKDATVTPRVGAVSVPSHSTVTAVGGDSPATVAQQVYGSSSPYHTELIRRANGIGTADEFVPGQIVRIPVV